MFDYNSTSYNELLKSFRENTTSKKVIIFAGKFAENRKYAISQFERETLGDTTKISLSEYVTSFENESFEKIDSLFEELKDEKSLVIFTDAEQLCGVYTGHTYSVVKYATPQEKYFIKKLKKLRCSVILEFENQDHLDRTILRAADAVVKFPVPSSFLEKVFFWVTQVRVNGSSLPSRRPV